MMRKKVSRKQKNKRVKFKKQKYGVATIDRYF